MTVPELIRTRRPAAPQADVVEDFEDAVHRAGVPALRSAARWDGVLTHSGRLLGRAGLIRRTGPAGPVRVVGLMGCAEHQLVPYGLRRPLALYVWDCWPGEASRWERLFRRLRPRAVFFSSRDAARHWRDRLPGTAVHWAPEAIELRRYPPGPDLAARPVTLLELGRRHDVFHAAARARLTARGARHRHSTPERPFVFPDRGTLVRGLHDSVALACFPGSMTHPGGRTGTWETMTHRYLEAAATRTLIVGHVPAEMTDLFGFAPGLTVDPAAPGTVLDQLAGEPGRHQDLVDRAYRRVVEIGGWDVRVRSMLSRL